MAVAGALLWTVSPVGMATAATEVTNGDFETDAVGSASVTGWTSTLDQVDLGVTSLGGCVATDGSDYTHLRNYQVYASRPSLDPFGASHPNLDWTTAVEPSGGGAQIQFNGQDLWYEEDVYYEWMLGSAGATTLDELVPYSDWAAVDQAAFDALYPTVDPALRADDDSVLFEESWVVVADESTAAASGGLGRAGKVLELFSTTDGEDYGYIAHGPAVVSDPFTVTGGLSIYLDWMAAGDEDDYHVYGYLLNTDTCAKTTVINSTGESHAWSTVEVPVTTLGTYRFVFVSGTYDQTWGGVGGALLYIDDIVLAPTSETAPGVPAIPATGSASTRVLILLAAVAVVGGLVLVRRSRLA